MATTVFFSGSFEIPTNGHLEIWAELINGFDKLIIGIGKNSQKIANGQIFSTEERIELIVAALQDWAGAYQLRGLNGRIFSAAETKAVKKYIQKPECIQICAYQGSSVLAAKKYKATHFVRGERITGDHDSEMALAAANRLIDETAGAGLCYLTVPLPRAELTFTSTSAVKGFCALGEYIAAKRLVTPTVHNLIMKKYLAPVYDKLCLGQKIPAAVCDDTYKMLSLQYKQRAYHNFSHIAYCLNLLNNIPKINARIKPLLELGFFYHDIYQSYDSYVGNKPAELVSARFCADLIFGDESKQEQLADNFTQLFLGNKETDSPFAAYTDIFTDIDFAILGDSANYGDYAQQIYSEYVIWCNASTFRQGRMEVLEKLLKQKRIFRTPEFYERFEENARLNIKRELGYWMVEEKFA